MGRAENIKRAKKLTEAKRKREQIAKVNEGLGPASFELKQRISKNGIEIQSNKGKIKFSELLQEFVQPFISDYDDISVVRDKFTIGVHAWNTANAKIKMKEIYQFAKADIIKIVPGIPNVEQIFDKMIERKQKKYPEYNTFFADFEIKKIHGDDYDLSVATTTLEGI